MIKNIHLGVASLVSFGVIFGVALFSTNVSAQVSGGAQGIQLSPALIELNAQRGATYTLIVKVLNVTTADLDYTVDVNDFAAKNETGSPQILYDSDLPRQISIRTWISSIPKFHLDTKKETKVTFNVTVPADAEPGGHYGVLRFSGSEPKVKGNGVGLSASAGTLLLVKVTGDIKEKANIGSFATAQNGNQTNFFEAAPVDFITRIQNTGNIHIKPFGNIEIKNIFGAVVATLPMNETKSNVLPDSIRRFDTTYGEYMLGPYTATVTVGYGTKGQAEFATTSFWVIPYKLIGTILLVLALVVFILKRSLKAYNKRVIKKYQNKQSSDEPKKHKKKSKK